MKPIFRDGKVHVNAQMCKTCIFRPGNLMKLRKGRVVQMVKKATSDISGSIPCHETLDGGEAVCRGFFDRHATPALQIADRMGVVKFVRRKK